MPLKTCPNCDVGMTLAKRSGIEIDICPQCRGVWLDRGELDKLLDPIRNDMRPEAPRDDFYRRNHYEDFEDRDAEPRKRRTNILDIFD